MMRKSVQNLVLAALAGLMLACGTKAAAPSTSALEGSAISFRYSQRWVQIESFDGTKLGASVYTPRTFAYPGKRPAVVMPASWAVNEFEYDIKAREMADDGYVVVSYAPRGFGSSEGLVDVAGPNSQRDVGKVFDWLLENTNADVDHMGVAGISYGAGLGLLAAAQDPRVKSVVALSGWADLRHALYDQQTVRQFWLDLIVGSGLITGNIDPDVLVQVTKLKTHTDVDSVMAWGGARSAYTMIEAINKRKVPIFIANSYEDNLFPPAQGRAFFSQLVGPKKFYLDHGIHGTSSIPGLIGLPNDVWTEARRWMDQWLAGVDTGIMTEEPVTFKTATGKSFYRDFPPLGEAEATFALQPLNTLETSTDSSTPKHPVVGFLAGIDSGATTGMPIISDVGSGVFNLPIRSLFAGIDQRFAAVYKTPHFDKGITLRGATRLHVPLEAHDGPMQLVGYLYDVDDWGVATLISYGVATRYTAEGASKIDLDLGVTAYDIPAGDHLVVAFDSIDPLYEAPFVFPYKLAITHTDASKVTIDLPLVR